MASTKILDKEALEAMIKSGVHGQRWSETVYLIALYNDTNYFTIRNTREAEHAEVEAIVVFEVLLTRRQLQPRVIKLFVSASPCSDCSQKIITFLETAKCHHGVDLKIEVVFSSFYRIRRPSCNRRNPVCRNHKHYSDDEHYSQVEGLKSLKVEPGVVLRLFNQQDWRKLRNVLRVYNIGYSCRKKEEKSLKEDFKAIMGVRTPPHRSVSRHQFQSPGAVGSSGVALSTDQCRANMSTDDCRVNTSNDESCINMSNGDCRVNMSNDHCLVNMSTDDCLVNMSNEESCVNMSTDGCRVNMFNDESCVNTSNNEFCIHMSNGDCRVNMSNEESCVNISNDDCLVNMSTDDCLVNMSNEESCVNMSTYDCLVNMSTDESSINLLTGQPKEVDLKLSLRSGQKMLWIITAIFILSLIVLAILILTHDSI